MFGLVREWLDLLKREFGGYSAKVFQKDLMASLTVTAVALPLALAFGVASGATAAAGRYLEPDQAASRAGLHRTLDPPDAV